LTLRDIILPSSISGSVAKNRTAVKLWHQRNQQIRSIVLQKFVWFANGLLTGERNGKKFGRKYFIVVQNVAETNR